MYQWFFLLENLATLWKILLDINVTNLCNNTSTFGSNSWEVAANLASVDTAAALTGAFSKMTLLKIYRIYLAGFEALGPSIPRLKLL